MKKILTFGLLFVMVGCAQNPKVTARYSSELLGKQRPMLEHEHEDVLLTILQDLDRITAELERPFTVLSVGTRGSIMIMGNSNR